MKNPFTILLNIGFWGCYLVVIMIILAVLFEGKPDSQARMERGFEIIFLFAIVPSIITFYSFYSILFPRYILVKKIGMSIVVGLAISLVSGIIGYILVTNRFGEDYGWEEGDDSPVASVLFLSFIALATGIIAVVIRGFITWLEEIKLKEALKQKNYETEMALVKSQLDPHFLFNTINNIDILILKNADQASNYLNKLSDIMRFMLYETKTDTVPLSKEIEYIEKYIELQKIRTSNASYVNYMVNGICGGKRIAPMVFIPFIENAFKHTTNKKIENAINIQILIEKETIMFVCENKFDPNRKLKQENNGLGNELIEKRLNLIYPDKHQLKVENENGLYSVILTINNG